MRAVVEVSGFSGTGADRVALRAFLADEHDPDVRLSQFAGLTLGAFFAHSSVALQRVEEEVRIGIRRAAPLETFGRRLKADDTLALVALDVAQQLEREEQRRRLSRLCWLERRVGPSGELRSARYASTWATDPGTLRGGSTTGWSTAGRRCRATGAHRPPQPSAMRRFRVG